MAGSEQSKHATMAHWVGAASYAGVVAEEKKERKERRQDRDADDSDDDIMGDAALALPGGLPRAPRQQPAAPAPAGRGMALDSDDDEGALHAGGDQDHSGDGDIAASLLDGDDRFSDDEATTAELKAAPRGQPLWNFAQEYGKYLTEDSPIMEQLMSFKEQYGVGDLSAGRLGRNIQTFYNIEVYPHLPDHLKRRWALSSIIDWLESTASEEAQRKIISKMAYAKLRLIGGSQLCTVDPITRKLKDRPDDDVRFHQWSRTWMQLQKKR